MKQAHALGELLKSSRPRTLLSSPSWRCVQTLEPLGRALDQPTVTRDELAKDTTIEQVLQLIDTAAPDTVLCTHGEVLELLLPALDAWSFEGHPSKDMLLLKGSAWRLDRATRTVQLRVPLVVAQCPDHT